MRSKRCSLYELAEWKNGLAFKKIDFSDSGKPIIKISELKNGITGQTQFTKGDYGQEVSLTKGDMVFSWSGNPETSIDVFWYDLPDGWLNQHIFKIIPAESVDKKYLYYLMKSFKPTFTAIASNKQTTGLGHVTIKDLKEIVVNLPEKNIQGMIGGYLYSIDKKIYLNKKINDNLYEMVNAYYTSLFKENDCEMTTVGNYAERIYSGGTPMTSNAAYWNGTFGWFSSGETRNRFVISTEKTITQAGIDNSSTKLATKYDIVMASAGQGFTRGQTSMLLIDTYVNQSVIVIKSERNILPYLFWNLANRYDELRAISDSSSIRGSLTTKMIAAFEIPLANEQSLQAFADFAWSVIPQIENNLLENERLTALRDSLLPKLMSGEIDVTDIQL